MNYRYKLYEDNGGFFHLAVLDDKGECIYYAADGSKDFILETLAALKGGADPYDWYGGFEPPQSYYEEIEGFLALRNGSVRELDV